MALLQKAYLGATPLFREQSWFEEVSANPVDVSSTVTVTADTAAHTKGAWSELVASTSASTTYIIVEVGGIAANATDTATLLDIGTGASGSEVALLANIAVGGAALAVARPAFAFGVPIKIASGTRLSARIQSVVTGGKTGTVLVRTFDMGDYAYAPASVDVMGSSTATSDGTPMSGSSGTYVQITASTSRAYKAIVCVPSSSSTNVNNAIVEFTVGVGASSSEVEVGRVNAHFLSTEEMGMATRYPTIMAANIPASSRIAVKHNASSGPGGCDVTLIGIP
jgi:hypothetical protein